MRVVLIYFIYLTRYKRTNVLLCVLFTNIICQYTHYYAYVVLTF